ncbi:MAG TPA: hypothetical protein VH482_32690 [Thermomicrobiales bacterium]|jgi:hypothetical protein
MATARQRRQPVHQVAKTGVRRATAADAADSAPTDARPPAPDARQLSGTDVVALQRTHGNAHVTRVLDLARVSPAPAAGVQRTPTVVQRTIDVAEAKRRIKKASAGWGTDEGGIYAAIRECNDRPALKADPEVQHYLKSEMKGHDLWKAQLLLEFGTEAAFPPTVKEIWGGTKGPGTDEDRIYKAIDKLTAGQLDKLLEIPGLRGILKADLNDSEMKRATGGAGILDRHKKNVAFVKTVLDDMKKPGNPAIIRNTGEWMGPTGGGAGKVGLLVLTKTHDSAARAKKHGNDNEVAYFGDTPKYPADTADYDLAITSTRNIHFAEPTVAGSQGSAGIRLMEPKKHGAAKVRSFLVHEVQHDADKHDLDPDWAKDYKTPEESWVRYRTEFRAYWLDGQRDPPRYSEASGSATNPKFDNAKQEAIFLHMYGTGPNDVYAEWLRPNYDGNTTVGGQKFQDLIHGYQRPEGINLINSPRIDDLYGKVKACTKTDKNVRVAPLKDAIAAAQALDADDHSYVNSASAAAFQQLMKDKLAAKALKQIAKIANGGALPHWAGGP